MPTPTSCLENPRDRGACWALFHGVARVRRDLATKPPPPQCWGGHYLVKAAPSAGGNAVFQKWLNCEPSAVSSSHSGANECPDPKGDLCGTSQPPLNMIIALFQMSTCYVVTVQLLSCVQVFVSLWTAACQASMSFTVYLSLLKLISIESMMPYKPLILCHPLLLLPSIFPSIEVFSNESPLCIRWSEYLSFSFSISPSSEYLGLVFFRMDWLDLLAI